MTDLPSVLVTGAGRGLGRAIAEAFHAQGWFVIATDYDAALLKDLEQTPRTLTARHDVGDIEAAADVAALIRAQVGRLDAVVNNAGVNQFYPVCEAPPQRTIDAFRINTFGALIVSQACLDLLVESRGRIVNIASESSPFRPPFQFYQSTKMALECLSDVMRRELQFLGVHVAIIRPGAIQTDLIEGTRNIEIDLAGSRFEPWFPNFRRMVERGIPSRVSTPAEVAQVVFRAATDPKKKVLYRINNDPKQRLALLVPKRLMDKFAPLMDGRSGFARVTGMRVPLVDVAASYREIRDELLPAIDAALSEGRLRLGPNVAAFEQEFAAFCEAPYGVGVSSGTDALSAGLEACGVGRGDEVVVPAITFFATVGAVVRAGAIPVVVDVEPETLTLDVAAVRSSLTAATRAVIPVHLFGQPVDMAPLLDLAAEHDLRVIEDAAQAHGARYRGRRCGSLGDVGCFSFYPTKNLGAFGEGGFVTAGDEAVAERLRLLREHGHTSPTEHGLIGANWRLDELQAIVLRLKLKRFEAAQQRRCEIAERYTARFAGSPLRPLAIAEGRESAHHLYVVRAPERDALAKHLERAGIGTAVHYARPVHRQAALREHPHRGGDTPVADAACPELLSLPLYPELTDEQIESVVSSVHDYYAGS
jgi:dTDP-4-amino-4,6-dideoxygalactose transaminase/NAD(P)-dependent dehydrogenase (short-subunit alcohol dehydrogenase family)